MTDENEVIDTEASAEAAEAAETAPEQQSDAPSFEDRALTMGWTPKSQFKGDPDKWVDAETFVKRGEEFLPFLKANNRRLEQALERANAKIEQMDKGLKSAIQQLSRADQRAYAKAKADLEAELEQYAAAGNAEAVKAVTKDLVDLEKETVAKVEDAPGEDPAFAEWREANPWFGKDMRKTRIAAALGAEVAEDGYTGKAQVKEVDRRLREEYPDWFAKPTNPNRTAAAPVEGVGAPLRSGAKTYSDLPAEAKAMCDELCRDMPKLMTREKFVKDYFAQEAKK